MRNDQQRRKNSICKRTTTSRMQREFRFTRQARTLRFFLFDLNGRRRKTFKVCYRHHVVSGGVCFYFSIKLHVFLSSDRDHTCQRVKGVVGTLSYDVILILLKLMKRWTTWKTNLKNLKSLGFRPWKFVVLQIIILFNQICPHSIYGVYFFNF